MKKVVIRIEQYGDFVSPGHIMNYFRRHDLHHDIDIKYLTQCIHKRMSRCKSLSIGYIYVNGNAYERMKSLVRSGQPFVKADMLTPLDYFKAFIAPLITKDDPVKDAIRKATLKNVGTEKDYIEMIKEYKKSL